jgi:hypothetical protein
MIVPAAARSLSFDPQSCRLDGARHLLLCGTIHYPRSTPDMWPALMRRARAAGLNCIETYVFWGQHEKVRGQMDFSGRLDLRQFCGCAAEEGLAVFLRPGPYICAEQDYGGFPFWLREIPGIRFRTRNAAYYAEVKRWFDYLFAHLADLFAPRGGPIVALQVENEYANIASAYGPDGVAYMEWLRDLMASYGTGVPLTACNPAGDDASMAQISALPGAIPTLNSGYAHPFVRAFRRWAPEAPCLWTEAWMAWYQVWGLPEVWRPASDMTFCSARFFAEGGKGINYFPWHGGTNFGRDGMYLQTTSYDFNAALDEFGCPTEKFESLGQLHRALLAYEPTLLAVDLPEGVDVEPGLGVRIFRQGDTTVEFLFNDDAAGSPARVLRWRDRDWPLSGQSVVMLANGKPVWQTVGRISRDRPLYHRRPTAPFDSAWRAAEAGVPTQGWKFTGKPVEQLALTQNATDYAWYRCPLEVAEDESGELTFKGINDFFQVFLDGEKIAESNSALIEDRGDWDGVDYQQSFRLTIPAGRHTLVLLVGSLGLVKGDWQAGRRNMVEERKGFWGEARWQVGSVMRPLEGWAMCPFYPDHMPVAAEWRPLTRGHVNRPLTWFETTVSTPSGTNPLMLDLAGLGKGLMWINGQCLGRYWLVRSRRPDKLHTEHNQVMIFDEPGSPSQRYYHVPRGWLTPTTNRLCFFEETGGDPSGVRLLEWVAAEGDRRQ